MHLPMKKKVRFKSARLKEISDYLQNPERGFYQLHTFSLGSGVSMTDKEYTLNSTDTIALVLISIASYKDRELDELAFTDLRRILDFFREYRLDVVLRIAYDIEGNCAENEPMEESLVMDHMDSLAPVIREYADIIFIYQGLLIGNWGEMHASKFLSPARLRKLSETFLSSLGSLMYLAVRRPSYVRVLFPEGRDLTQRQVGIFDDAILASPTHLGTFGTAAKTSVRREQAWLPDEERSYMAGINDHAPYGGEALWSDEKDSLEKVRTSLKGVADYFSRLHLTYLNRVYDNRFIDRLKEQTWKGRDVFFGMNGYDYIERHLGYRPVLREVSCSVLENDQDTLKWELTIENVGFARAFFETAAWMHGIDETGRDCSIDISHALVLTQVGAGEKRSFRFVTCRLVGDIYLEMAMKCNGHSITFANENQKQEKKQGLYIGTIHG